MRINFKINSTLDDFFNDLKKTVSVGIAGSIQGKRGTLTPAGKGLFNEFGTKNIPARPFLIPTVTDEKVIGMGLKLAIKSGRLATFAEHVADEVKNTIYNMKVGQVLNGKPIRALSKKTIKRKKNDALLIDTAQMVEAITTEIK